VGKVDQLRALREARFAAHASEVTSQALPSGRRAVQRRPLAVVTTPAEPAPTTAERPVIPARKPVLPAGRPIGQYSDRQLEDLIRWILGNRPDLDVPGVLDAVMDELGFVRRGKVIKERVLAALLAVQE
jgi:hypothetical protein